MKFYLKNRFDNTFKGRSFIEGIKLLNKPAITPTIMDDENKKEDERKKEQEQEWKNGNKANISNQNYPMKRNI
jgi:hypothetical protein